MDYLARARVPEVPRAALMALIVGCIVVPAITLSAAGLETTMSPGKGPIFREADRGQQQQQHSVGKRLPTNRAGALDSVQARLMKEFKAVQKCESHKKGIFQVELKDDNLQEWHVKLFFSQGALHKDLATIKRMGQQDHVMLHLSFGKNYPMEPPFARIVYPVLHGKTIYKGGSLCNDLLTGNSWDSSYTMETFILTMHDAMQNNFIRVRMTETMLGGVYSEEKAKKGFEYIKNYHNREGWQ